MDNDQGKPTETKKADTYRDGSESPGPTFDEVVRKMLNTPPKPKKSPPSKPGETATPGSRE